MRAAAVGPSQVERGRGARPALLGETATVGPDEGRGGRDDLRAGHDPGPADPAALPELDNWELAELHRVA